MNWLSQNWTWIVLLVGAYFLISRRGMGGCGMGMGHSCGHSHHASGQGKGTAGDARIAPLDLDQRRPPANKG